jgi:hypothetical protein
MFTQKKTWMIGLTLAAAGLAICLLTDKKYRSKIKSYLYSTRPEKDKYNQDIETKIGNPHPRDEGDNNMVSEGSLYSVTYYNEKKD